jgi:hypothetical protein
MKSDALFQAAEGESVFEIAEVTTVSFRGWLWARAPPNLFTNQSKKGPATIVPAMRRIKQPDELGGIETQAPYWPWLHQ